jgi:GSH-dependent disulfide-bond oxidoreductase
VIDLYFWPTPNGQKIPIMLEECGLAYRVCPVNILVGEQFSPDFLEISPNNRIPAIVDHDDDDGGEGGTDLTLFESGAILEYLAEKTGMFMPRNRVGKYTVLQWLYFQVSGVGPMFGQCGHFMGYAPEKIPYAIERYQNETKRLYGVLNKRLADHPYLATDYSIADMAVYPWIEVRWLHEIEIDEFPHVKRWHEAIKARPAVERAMAILKEKEVIGNPSDETREIFFGKSQLEQKK